MRTPWILWSILASATVATAAVAVDGLWVGSTPGPAVFCTWSGRGARVDGACALDPAAGPAAGDYRLAGRRHARHLRLAGRRPDGVRLTAFAQVASGGGWSVRLDVHGTGLRWHETTLLLPRADAGDPAAAWLYDAACGRCHGADARGTPGRPAVRCSLAIASTVRAGLDGGVMPAFASRQFSDDDVEQIQSALRAWCAADDAQTRAADLYASNCARCHGRDGAGTENLSGTQGPDIRCKTAQLLVADIASGDAGMPAFPELGGGPDAMIADWVQARCDRSLP